MFSFEANVGIETCISLQAIVSMVRGGKKYDVKLSLDGCTEIIDMRLEKKFLEKYFANELNNFQPTRKPAKSSKENKPNQDIRKMLQKANFEGAIASVSNSGTDDGVKAEQTIEKKLSEKRKLQSPLRVQNPKESKRPNKNQSYNEENSAPRLEFSLGIDDISDLCEQLNSSSIEPKSEINAENSSDSDEEFVSLASRIKSK